MLLRGGLVRLAGVVTGAGSDLHATESLRLRLNANRTIATLRLRFDGLVADGVLVANIVGNILRDLVDFVQIAWEECHATGPFRQSAQSALVTLLARLIVAEDANGVDDRSILVLDVSNSLLQRHAAGIIFTVGHDKQNLLIK